MDSKRRGLLEKELTGSILDSFRDVPLHSAAQLQLFSYLCATDIEIGLLLHFGREAKFQRVICENRLKQHRA